MTFVPAAVRGQVSARPALPVHEVDLDNAALGRSLGAVICKVTAWANAPVWPARCNPRAEVCVCSFFSDYTTNLDSLTIYLRGLT